MQIDLATKSFQKKGILCFESRYEIGFRVQGSGNLKGEWGDPIYTPFMVPTWRPMGLSIQLNSAHNPTYNPHKWAHRGYPKYK